VSASTCVDVSLLVPLFSSNDFGASELVGLFPRPFKSALNFLLVAFIAWIDILPYLKWLNEGLSDLMFTCLSCCSKGCKAELPCLPVSRYVYTKMKYMVVRAHILSPTSRSDVGG